MRTLSLKDATVEVQYAEEFSVTLYQLSADRRWVDLGPGQLILEACIYSSRASKFTQPIRQYRNLLLLYSCSNGQHSPNISALEYLWRDESGAVFDNRDRSGYHR